MWATGMGLSWIVVKDLKQALAYYHELLRLEIVSLSAEHGRAELRVREGMTLGIAQATAQEPIGPGSNAVVMMSVERLEETKQQLSPRGVSFIGEVLAVLGHVKMQRARWQPFPTGRNTLVELFS